MKTEVSKIKWGTNTKTDRNVLLKEYASQHPDFTLKEIGKIFSVTPQRVFQIMTWLPYGSRPTPLSLERRGGMETKMTLAKAIEIKEAYLRGDEPDQSLDWILADRLSIKALERCLFVAKHSPHWKAKLLPGEAEE